MTSIAATLDEYDQQLAFKQLRVARRKNRIRDLDYFDAFYKAYLSALIAIVGIYVGAGALGDRRLDAHHLSVLAARGPAVLGAVVAAAVAVGLRSGGRGGPLAFERAYVRHVLMSPIDKRSSIRGPAINQLRHAAFLAVSFGGALGIIAGRRFPESIVLWVLCGAAFGLLAVVAAFGAAMIAGGLRAKSWLADLLSLLALAWAGADIALKMQTSPFTWIGSSALLPLNSHLGRQLALSGAGLAFALVVAGFGVGLINRMSIEAAERRSRLIGQLRFAATLQDVRTVMVIQRQLSQEHLRAKPWIRLPRSKRAGFKGTKVANGVYVRRSLSGLLRWPFARYVRLVIFVTIAAFSIVGVWGGTTGLILVAGLAMWLAGLDLVEGLAQEVDHPDRVDSMPRSLGVVYSRHLLVPFGVMFFLLVIVWAFMYAFVHPRAIVTNLGPLVICAALGSIGGAAIAVTQKPPMPGANISTPEIASVKFFGHMVLPPAIALIGLLPVIGAQRGWDKFHTIKGMVASTSFILTLCLMIGAWAVAWIRYADDFKRWIKIEPIAPPAKGVKPTSAAATEAATKRATPKKKNGKKK